MPATVVKNFLNYIRLRNSKNSIKDYDKLSLLSSAKNVKFDEGVYLAAKASVSDSHVGRYTSIGYASKIVSTDIGGFCAISWNTTINAINHPVDHLTISAFPYVKKFSCFNANSSVRPEVERVSIGHDVWIGAYAIILPGVKIGNGVVIGAGSIVTKDVPPYAIVAGSPAKLIRYRFSPEIISQLMKLKWWNWGVEKINRNMIFFQQSLDQNLVDELKFMK